MKKIRNILYLVICIFFCLEQTGCKNEKEDYEQYIRKIWICDTDMEQDLYEMPFSFYITDIDSGIIEGKFQLGGDLARPEYYSDASLTWPKSLGEFKGSITDGIAKCTFHDEVGDDGELSIIFKESNRLEVNIKIVNARDSLKDCEIKEKYYFRPYNLSDIEGLNVSKDHTLEIELNNWGQVYFVSGRVDDTDGKYFPVSYLTNMAGDVLYEFHPGYLAGTEISDVVIEDINGDTLKDISITTLLTWENTESYYAIKWDSYQMEDGRFYLNSSTEIVEER